MEFDLKKVQSNIEPDMKAVDDWCNEIYDSQFSNYFKDIKELYLRFQNDKHPITDEELSIILTEVPLNLFSVSENINRIRLNHEVLKLKIKETRDSIIHTSPAKTQSQRKEDADIATLEQELLSMAYTTVITRVENEISFTREIIMAAKKLWDSRRRSEGSMPVGPVDEDLPAYNPNSNKSYIKG